MRIPLPLLPAIAGLALVAASKPEQHVAIRFHVEAQIDPGKKFTIPINLVTRPGQTAMAKLATVTERDIAEILSTFTAHDGSSGIAFQLDPHGRNKLHLDSAQNIGKFLFVFFNGRHLTELLIDRPVSDGIIVIPRGLSEEDVTAIKDYLFPKTEKEKREAKRLQTKPDAALPPPPEETPATPAPGMTAPATPPAAGAPSRIAPQEMTPRARAVSRPE